MVERRSEGAAPHSDGVDQDAAGDRSPRCPRCNARSLAKEEFRSGVYALDAGFVRLHPPRYTAVCLAPECGYTSVVYPGLDEQVEPRATGDGAPDQPPNPPEGEQAAGPTPRDDPGGEEGPGRGLAGASGRRPMTLPIAGRPTRRHAGARRSNPGDPSVP